jgi:hypothetical protein
VKSDNDKVFKCIVFDSKKKCTKKCKANGTKCWEKINNKWVYKWKNCKGEWVSDEKKEYFENHCQCINSNKFECITKDSKGKCTLKCNKDKSKCWEIINSKWVFKWKGANGEWVFKTDSKKVCGGIKVSTKIW